MGAGFAPWGESWPPKTGPIVGFNGFQISELNIAPQRIVEARIPNGFEIDALKDQPIELSYDFSQRDFTIDRIAAIFGSEEATELENVTLVEEPEMSAAWLGEEVNFLPTWNEAIRGRCMKE